jgi:hypothetical protein
VVEVSTVERERAVDEIAEGLADRTATRRSVAFCMDDPEAHRRPAATAGAGFAG